MGNLILEGLVITLLQEMSKHGDENLHIICDKIITDELDHVQFGVDQIKDVLSKKDKQTYKKLLKVQRQTLRLAIFIFLNLARESGKMGIAWDDLAEKALSSHIKQIKSTGLHLPFLEKVFLKFCILFLKFI